MNFGGPSKSLFCRRWIFRKCLRRRCRQQHFRDEGRTCRLSSLCIGLAIDSQARFSMTRSHCRFSGLCTGFIRRWRLMRPTFWGGCRFSSLCTGFATRWKLPKVRQTNGLQISWPLHRLYKATNWPLYWLARLELQISWPLHRLCYSSGLLYATGRRSATALVLRTALVHQDDNNASAGATATACNKPVSATSGNGSCGPFGWKT